MLVATTVIEVGVDVPNATIMIVQEADRFGLAQLHQLRGRVGRGAEQSYCLLVSGPKEELTESAHDRLEAMVASTDGFELAEKDLEIRGGGALLGARQSGLSDLRFARITHDRELLEQARDAARSLPAGDDGGGGRRPPRRRRASRQVLGVRITAPRDELGPSRPLARAWIRSSSDHSAPASGAVLEVFAGLSERSRRLRFLGSKPRLLESDLAYLVDVGRRGHEAVVAVDQESGRTVGIARFVRDAASPEAEIAFEVVDGWQGRGLGKQLVTELRALALGQGILRFRALIAHGNRPAFALVHGLGEELTRRYQDGDVELVVRLS